MTEDGLNLERLRRAMRLAEKGRFSVEPNPLVGCVLERDGRVVGEGWHLAYGGPHAEVVALAKAGEEARGATAYVTLEPCSRTGKTGPCTEALKRAGVARVVLATLDPHEGGGSARSLGEGGIERFGPRLEDEALGLLEPMLRHDGRTRPWVVLKWAMTLDGRIAEGPGRGGAITGAQSRALVHEMRAHADAVAVGIGTVLIDDPRLTCRLDGGPPHGRPQPTRVVFDSSLRTPIDARLFEDVEEAALIVVTAKPDRRRVSELEARGATVLEAAAPDGRVDLSVALGGLRERGIHRLLVEGGARTHGAFLRRGLADQAMAFVAPRILGVEDAPGAVHGAGFGSLDQAARLECVRWKKLGDDLMVEGYVPL